MRIGLIDMGTGKLPNLAIMKLSAHHKALGHTVLLNDFGPADVDHVFCSVVFSKDRKRAAELKQVFPSIEFGGSGWSLETKLPANIERLKPDYDLYTSDRIYRALQGRKATRMEKAERIANAGIGYTTRGCPSHGCKFCIVPKKEGDQHQVADLADLVNPRSNIITLLDNNLTSDELGLLKLRQAREMGLVLNITQGVDIRYMSDEMAHELSRQKLWSNLHFAWDQPRHETEIMRGIDLLSRHIKTYLQTCFVLVGFDSDFSEDMMRVRKLHERGVRPYVMRFNWNQRNDKRLDHFARWVNQHFYKRMSFDDYKPWQKVRDQYFAGDLFTERLAV